MREEKKTSGVLPRLLNELLTSSLFDFLHGKFIDFSRFVVIVYIAIVRRVVAFAMNAFHREHDHNSGKSLRRSHILHRFSHEMFSSCRVSGDYNSRSAVKRSAINEFIGNSDKK